jgi:spore germination cell wall hydrolase CwlJ-like protein
LEAIRAAEIDTNAALNATVLANYANTYQPMADRLAAVSDVATSEQLCLTQAIYHEARGESVDGQWAVANIIINRAMSGRYPNTLCGVVFQNADRGRYRCQFTFACDGRSDMGTERTAWNRAADIARTAYSEFAHGDRPDVLPASALYYHTRAVSPSWSRSFRRVAAIGSHIFYSPN